MFAIDVLIGIAQIDYQLLSLLDILSNHVDVLHFQHFNTVIDSEKGQLDLYFILLQLLVDEIPITEDSLSHTQWLISS